MRAEFAHVAGCLEKSAVYGFFAHLPVRTVRINRGSRD